MTWLRDFFGSTVGRKAIMAVTGIILFGFLVGHLLGNLKLWLGAESLNHYAEGLRVLGDPILPKYAAIWIARIGLLGALVLHFWAAITLTLRNRKARPEKYKVWKAKSSDYASRTMIWGGMIVLLFIVYHLLHLTVGSVHSDFIYGDVYHNVTVAFSDPLVALVYIVANVALGFHLYHGLWSLFQTLGFNGPRVNQWRRAFAIAFALIISVGNIMLPLSVLLGLVPVETAAAATLGGS
ncbi:MAG: succinate dehydrogenase cytochrome b subunit [Acidobacteriota bacterium]